MAPGVLCEQGPAPQDTQPLLDMTKADAIVAVNGINSGDFDFQSAENPSLQVTADHRLKYVAVPVRKPERGEALVRIAVTGICGCVLDKPTRHLPLLTIQF